MWQEGTFPRVVEIIIMIYVYKYINTHTLVAAGLRPVSDALSYRGTCEIMLALSVVSITSHVPGSFVGLYVGVATDYLQNISFAGKIMRTCH